MKSRMFVVLTSLLLTAGMCFGQSAPKDSGQNPGFPRVVAKLNLFNRTKSLGPQTLYVPKQSGVFRISAAIVCTIANNVESTDWAVSPGYTNEVGLNGGNPIASVPANFVSSSYNFYAPLIFNSSSNTPITIVISGPDNTGSQYNVYIVLEQLE